MSDYSDYEREDGYERQLRIELDSAAHSYLAHNGDAIERRVQRCLSEAERLLTAGFHGAALVSATTAIELTVRYFLAMPLVMAIFRTDDLADLVVERVLPSGPRASSADRDLLPQLLREWDIDITKLKASNGGQLWEQIKTNVIPARNRYVHHGGEVGEAEATTAVECARQLMTQVVDPLATRLGFTRAETGAWAKIAGEPPEPGWPVPFLRSVYSADDPFDRVRSQ
jgi:hypothetical protein